MTYINQAFSKAKDDIEKKRRSLQQTQKEINQIKMNIELMRSVLSTLIMSSPSGSRTITKGVNVTKPSQQVNTRQQQPRMNVTQPPRMNVTQLQGVKRQGVRQLQGMKGQGVRQLQGMKGQGVRPLQGTKIPGGRPLQGMKRPGGRPHQGMKRPGVKKQSFGKRKR